MLLITANKRYSSAGRHAQLYYQWTVIIGQASWSPAAKPSAAVLDRPMNPLLKLLGSDWLWRFASFSFVSWVCKSRACVRTVLHYDAANVICMNCNHDGDEQVVCFVWMVSSRHISAFNAAVLNSKLSYSCTSLRTVCHSLEGIFTYDSVRSLSDCC